MTKQPNHIDVEIGQRVRMARQDAKMSQEKLGDHLGITFQQIQKYEKGTNRIAGSRLVQIGDVLGLDAGKLMAGLGTGEKQPIEMGFLTQTHIASLNNTMKKLTKQQQEAVARVALKMADELVVMA